MLTPWLSRVTAQLAHRTIQRRPSAGLCASLRPVLHGSLRSFATNQKLPLSFSHMGMWVVSPEKLSDFYTRFLGFTITDRGHLPNPAGGEPLNLVFLSRDPEEHHQVVLVSGRPNTDPPPFNTINQISFRTDSLQTLKEIYERLAVEHDVSEIHPVTHGNAISIYFKDPEGNRLECFIDSPWYVSQPCREPVDFSEPEDVIWAKTEQLARELPGFCPRSEWVAKMRKLMGLA